MPSKLDRHQKYEKKDGTVVPGTTTITNLSGLNKGVLMGWMRKEVLAGRDPYKVRDQSADIGTVAHALIEEYINREHLGNENYVALDREEYAPKVMEPAELAFEAYLKWESENEIVYEGTELQLVSEKMSYGGTIDIVAIINGVKRILDLKTSSGVYEDHIMQIAGYRNLYLENHRELRKCSILRLAKKESPIPFEPKEIPDEIIDIGFGFFERLLWMYYNKGKLNV